MPRAISHYMRWNEMLRLPVQLWERRSNFYKRLHVPLTRIFSLASSCKVLLSENFSVFSLFTCIIYNVYYVSLLKWLIKKIAVVCFVLKVRHLRSKASFSLPLAFSPWNNEVGKRALSFVPFLPPEIALQQ